MFIFCATCYESSNHNITVAINESNTNGNCSKCGSHAVMPADILQRHAEDNKVVEQTPKVSARTSPKVWRKQNAEGINWLFDNKYIDAAQQWDGFSIEIVFENGDARLDFHNVEKDSKYSFYITSTKQKL